MCHPRAVPNDVSEVAKAAVEWYAGNDVVVIYDSNYYDPRESLTE